MNKKRIRQMDLALRRRWPTAAPPTGFAGHDELLRRIETEGYMQRFAPLFNGARLRCADVLALCREELDALCGGAPQEGWLSYAYDYARRLLYPEKTGAGALRPRCCVLSVGLAGAVCRRGGSCCPTTRRGRSISSRSRSWPTAPAPRPIRNSCASGSGSTSMS